MAAVLVLKPTWTRKWFKTSVGTSRKVYIYKMVFQGGGDGDGRGYRNMYKMTQGPTWINVADVRDL